HLQEVDREASFRQQPRDLIDRAHREGLKALGVSSSPADGLVRIETQGRVPSFRLVAHCLGETTSLLAIEAQDGGGGGTQTVREEHLAAGPELASPGRHQPWAARRI